MGKTSVLQISNIPVGVFSVLNAAVVEPLLHGENVSKLGLFAQFNCVPHPVAVHTQSTTVNRGKTADQARLSSPSNSGTQAVAALKENRENHCHYYVPESKRAHPCVNARQIEDSSHQHEEGKRTLTDNAKI